MDVLDYLASNQIYTFEQKPFNDVDNLILSHISYLTWAGVIENKPKPFNELVETYFKKYHDDVVQILPSQTKERRIMLSMMMNSNRYKNMKMFDYVDDIDMETQKQFSALTIEVDNGLYYVSIKGTDEKLVSWKEDFNMAYLDPIPAQTEALEYVQKLLKNYKGNVMIGGHSKGGNLAVYAGVKACDDRIIKVYNNDGPGFAKGFLESKEYLAMASRMVSIVPESSVVGMLFGNTMERKIVPSNVDGIMQHDGLTWEVDGDDFIHLEKLSDFSKCLNEAIMGWFDGMEMEQKFVFIDNIYEVIEKMQIKTVEDLYNNKLEFCKTVIKAMVEYDKKTKIIMLSTIVDLLKSSGYGVVDTFLLKKINARKTAE